MSARPPPADRPYVQEQDDIRQHVTRLLEQRAEAIGTDALLLAPFARTDAGESDLTARMVELALQVLIAAMRDGEVDPRSSYVVDLRRAAREKQVSIRQLFGLVYLLERATLDELALDESFGATSEPWPSIAQLVRRSSFDVVAGFAERLGQEAGEDALIDPLTTLHTRAVLLAVMEKELQRSERFGHPFALIVFDIDRLTDINARHGYGFGDRVLERIGIVLRNYFREQDWVCRSAGDTFGVLLPETQREHAEQLAERVRATVQERMALRDYRSEEQVPVTVSAGVVIVEAVDASVRAEHLLKEAEQAVHRAKHAGRNRVERVDINVRAALPPVRDAERL